MALNYIWIGFFVLTFVFALSETIFNGNFDVWSQIMSSSFDSAKTAFDKRIKYVILSNSGRSIF